MWRDFRLTEHKRHTVGHGCSWGLIGLAVCLALAGCAKRQTGTAGSRAGVGSTREVTDETGRRIRVPVEPRRVISLAPNLTEIVFAVGAGDKLVGDTTFCDYPPQARSVAKVGDTLHPDIERILALRPDLVLVSTASQLESFTSQLEEQGASVYLTDPHDLESVFHSIVAVGQILNCDAGASRLVSELRARASEVEKRVESAPRIAVFYQLSPEPLYTAGHDSYLTDLIRRAGGRSVTADVPGEWPRFSDEAALAANPDAIIIAGDAGSSTELAPALRHSPAALRNRVYTVSGDLLSRPGPRLVDGLEQMARILHPERFTQT